MWTRPKRMAPFQSSRGMFFLSAAGRRGVDEPRHAHHRRPGVFLAHRGLAARAPGRELEPAALVRRSIERADRAHVGEAFLAARLGIAPFQDAVRKVEKLGGELIALPVLDRAILAVTLDVQLEPGGEVVAGLHANGSPGAHHAVLRRLVGAEAHREAREAVAGKTQDAARGFLDAALVLVALARDAVDFHRLDAE